MIFNRDAEYTGFAACDAGTTSLFDAESTTRTSPLSWFDF